MTIPALPALDRTSPTFRTDVDTFFATQLPAFSAALDPEIERLNAVGYGSYNASSTTSLTIGTGSKSLTVETGKGYVVGQAVLIASTAGPTNYMTGQVTSYNSGTGALVVNVTATGGSGTVAAWTVSVTALSAGGGGVSPYSIVELTSGTSWTCPAGVTKLVGYVEGGCGGGASGNGSTISGGGGGGGGGVQFIASVSPGTSYTYAIGAGGAGASGPNSYGDNGGSTSITIGAVTYTGSGGGGGAQLGLGGAGGYSGYGTGGGLSVRGNYGASTNGTSNVAQYGGRSAFGCGQGGTGGPGGGSYGTAGRITLELYK